MTDPSNNVVKLLEICGPGAKISECPNQDVLRAAVTSVTKRRNDKIQGRVEEQLEKGLGIANQMVAAKREFDKQYAKMDEELGVIVNGLLDIKNGKESPPLSNTETPAEALACAA
jgi:hypothetical protein